MSPFDPRLLCDLYLLLFIQHPCPPSTHILPGITPQVIRHIFAIVEGLKRKQQPGEKTTVGLMIVPGGKMQARLGILFTRNTWNHHVHQVPGQVCWSFRSNLVDGVLMKAHSVIRTIRFLIVASVFFQR